MKPSFEDFRLPVTKTFLVALGLVIFITIISVILSSWQQSRPKESPSERVPITSPRHQIEFESGALAREARSKQLKELQAYSWKDAQKQFAEVPIERAMESLLEGDKK